jgi:hypothetical protein
MEKDYKNKAIDGQEKEVKNKAPEPQEEEFFFPGGQEYLPCTIKAKSRQEAEEKYNQIKTKVN